MMEGPGIIEKDEVLWENKGGMKIHGHVQKKKKVGPGNIVIETQGMPPTI